MIRSISPQALVPAIFGSRCRACGKCVTRKFKDFLRIVRSLHAATATTVVEQDPRGLRRARRADGKRPWLTDEVVDEHLWMRWGMAEPLARAPRLALAGTKLHTTHECWVKDSFGFYGIRGC